MKSNLIKKILGISIVCVFVLLSLCGCTDAAKGEAKSCFENTLNAFKSGDREEINKYYSFDRISAYVDKQNGEMFKDAVIGTLKDVEYDIKSTEKVSAETVKLTVNLKTIDFSKVIESFIDKISETADSAEYKANFLSMTDEEYNTLINSTMTDCIDKCKDKKKETQVEVIMIKSSEGNWIIGGDSEEILGVLFANISNAADYLT